ncbi:MAG: hypothetical protein IPM96_17370 [Ignavibacteria bacterium]|nr:hypothetical protein [Ignavibacteria bacterium]
MKNNETKLKMDEYLFLIPPTITFLITFGIRYHSNKDLSEDNSFWNLQMDIPVKVYTQKKIDSHLNLFLNFEIGYSGFIGSENELSKYLNIDRAIFTLKRNSQAPILSVYYLNGGIGVSILKSDFIPMISVNYGVYGQSTLFDIAYVNSSTPYQYNSILSKAHIGQDLTLELSFKIGKFFNTGYTFKNYKINSNISFLNNKYSIHYNSFGFTSF